MANHVGHILGDYRLVRELGVGTFGTVYQAEHIYIGTQVAIKVLHGKITDAERQKLRQEARNQASLEHVHIIPVLGYSEQPLPYLVMKFAPNSTLQKRYPMGRRFPLVTIIPHVRQIAEGLQHAHTMNTLHLDLKPANVLLGKQQEAQIADFGIAVILAEHRTHQTVGAFAGTPAYAAPEQVQNKPGKNSDQYALAVMVYQWLTGTLPFVGDVWSIGVQKLTGDPPPLRNYVPDLPPAVEQVVLRALAKDPRARFSSVLEFVQTLEEATSPKRTNSSPPICLQVASQTDPGKVQFQNVDSCFFHTSSTAHGHKGLFVVADGMDGNQAGEIASRLAVGRIREALAPLYLDPSDNIEEMLLRPGRLVETLNERLKLAVIDANETIFKYGKARREANGLHSTVTFALVLRDYAFVVNVGNSRTYLLRNGQLRLVTKDHTEVAKLIDEGYLTPHQGHDHPQRHELTRVLGRTFVEVDVFFLMLEPGDLLLLCTDGLWEMIRDEAELTRILSSSASVEIVCQQLIDTANEYGGEDNITAMVVRCSG